MIYQQIDLRKRNREAERPKRLLKKLTIQLRCLTKVQQNIVVQKVFLQGYPGSTLHGYLSKILARSCQDLGKFLAKIVTRYCQELQDAMVRSYQESHVSKKNLTKKPNMARKKLLRTARYREKVESENH